MADVSTGTIIKSWTEGGTNGRRHVRRIVDLLGTFTAGGTTNKILAAAFGLRSIETAGIGVIDDNSKIYPTVPANDGSMLLVLDVSNATDATRANPVDITVTTPRKLRVEVSGTPL